MTYAKAWNDLIFAVSPKGFCNTLADLLAEGDEKLLKDLYIDLHSRLIEWRLVNVLSREEIAAGAEKIAAVLSEADLAEAKKDEKEEVTEEPTTEEVTEAAVPDGYEDPEMVSTGAPVLKLTTHEVHIKAGGDFYTMDYVEDAVDDKDTKDYLYDNMFLDSVYDKSKVGTYELIYFCVDSDGNRSNSAKLKLYVE